MFWNNKQKLNIAKTLKNRDRDLNFTPFLKLYYKYPEKYVKFEGQSKEYYSFNDMLIDFPEFCIHKYEIPNFNFYKVVSGYFYHFRGNFYNELNIEKCISELISKYKHDDLYSNPKNKCYLLEKDYFNIKFKKTNCFNVELCRILPNSLNIPLSGFVSQNKQKNQWSTISVGINGKPLIFNDKVLIINLKGHNNINLKFSDLNFFEINYGYAILTRGKTPILNLESLLKFNEVKVNLLEYENVDFDIYLQTLLKEERKRKLIEIKKSI